MKTVAHLDPQNIEVTNTICVGCNRRWLTAVMVSISEQYRRLGLAYQHHPATARTILDWQNGSLWN